MKIGNLLVSWKYEGRKTYCVLKSAIKEGEIHPQIGCAYVKRMISDPQNKEKARRLSMAKALCACGIERNIRKEIWETYRTLPKTPRW